MLWLTWRQHRVQVLVTVALLAGTGVALLVHGLAAADFAAGHAPPGCPGPAPACAAIEGAMGQRYQQMYQFLGWLPVAPALIGAFWGAPVLAGEFERGTHKLAWTQSVPRGRWLMVKLGGLAVAVTLGGLTLGAMVSGWLWVFRGTDFADAFSSRGMFSIAGVAPAAWWLFFFAFGAAAGAVLRRTLPAMAVTLAVFALVLFGVFSARDHYATPEQVVQTSVVDGRLPMDAILTSYSWTDRDGRALSDDAIATTVRRACPDVGERDSSEECLYGQGYRQIVGFHPSSRFWRFQWTETGILLAGTLALGGVAVLRAARQRG